MASYGHAALSTILRMSKSYNILLAVTGSVASIKLPDLIKELQEIPGVDIRVLATEHSKHFWSLSSLPANCQVYSDSDEWSGWQRRGDPVLHIELRRWADILLIAPLDANTMAKMALGMCDNLLSCVVRAWDVNKPLVFCPGMNTLMWEHPVTAQHLLSLKQFGYHLIPPVSKTLACGDTGMGAMADIKTIVQFVYKQITNSAPTVSS